MVKQSYINVFFKVDIEKALAIQVDDPIPFMQLLAKADSGITEVRANCSF